MLGIVFSLGLLCQTEGNWEPRWLIAQSHCPDCLSGCCSQLIGKTIPRTLPFVSFFTITIFDGCPSPSLFLSDSICDYQLVVVPLGCLRSDDGISSEMGVRRWRSKCAGWSIGMRAVVGGGFVLSWDINRFQLDVPLLISFAQLYIGSSLN